MSNKQYPVPFESAPGSSGGGGATSVGLTVNSTSPSGIFTVTGSPVTTSGSLNFNLAGTSGGVPYFSSGTVLSSSLALASTGVVLGGGAATAPLTSTALTFSTPTLTVGLAGTSSGVLSLTGSTSGNATITAPAVAGTITNAILVSNSLQLPSGTVLSFNGDTGISRLAAGSFGAGNGTAGDITATFNAGFFHVNVFSGAVNLGCTNGGNGGFYAAPGRVDVLVGSAVSWEFGNGYGGLIAGSAQNIGWAATSNPAAASGVSDISIGRVSAGVLGVGTVASGGGQGGQLNLNTLGLAGATSGLATLTAPAVAGTITNAVLSSNSIQIPGGAVLQFNTDASITRVGVGVIGFGNGTPQDISASIQATNPYFQQSVEVFNNLGGGATYKLWSSGTGNTRNWNMGTGFRAAGDIGWIQGNTAGADPNVSGTIMMTIGFTGGVLVGATSGGGTDEGAGTINVATGYYANGTAGVSAGPFTAVTSITTAMGLVTVLSGTSDERLKNAEPYEGGLEAILAINPVRYRWNEKGQAQTGLSGEQDFVGFIAQDVQKAIPEAITATEPSKDKTETYLSLDDRPILAAAVCAIKQLCAIIQEQEKRIKALEEK